MGKLLLFLSGIVYLCLLPAKSYAQEPTDKYPYEQMIQEYLSPYDLSADNLMRLAMYAELKGQYSSEYQSLSLEFGTLAKLTFYNGNCLLRTASNRVYHLDQRRTSARSLTVMDQELTEIFDRILLLGNHDADPELIAFVDEALARKNIEPFQKMYLRHVLIRYGYFDKEYKRVIFHTDWLPDQLYAYRGPKDESIVEKPIEPLKVKLDAGVIRGYYLNSGGTVYVENVNREVPYATGEQYDYNVHAFKLFAQRLFTQTTQYVVGTEQNRLDEQEAQMAVVVRDVMEEPTPSESTPLMAQNVGRTRGLATTAPSQNSVLIKDLGTEEEEQVVFVGPMPYTEYDWIPMMLAQLRSRGINVGDPDIIKYFVDHPDFQQLYNMMTPVERERADRWQER